MTAAVQQPVREPIRDHRVDGLAWREAGSSARPTVLLLHGLGDSSWSWSEQLAGLSDRYHVVAWDLPGYGDSSPLPELACFSQWADSVDRLVAAAAIDEVHLVGHSMGGMIAQHVAARRPGWLVSLTLIATSPVFGMDGTDHHEWRQQRLEPLDRGLQPGDYAESVVRRLAAPGVGDQVVSDQAAAMARIRAEALRTSIACLPTHDARVILHRIGVPTLCIGGELDTETPPEYVRELARLIPDAVVELVPGSGHLVPAEAPHVVNRLVARHVDRHAARDVGGRP